MKDVINNFQIDDLTRLNETELKELYFVLKYAPTTNYKKKQQLSKLLQFLSKNNISF